RRVPLPGGALRQPLADRPSHHRLALEWSALLWSSPGSRLMTAERAKPIRCAIYTRKSSEEGLDQAFNSLHAQREACEAYVKSQADEGWRLVARSYDDGGLSGGHLERPALQRL